MFNIKLKTHSVYTKFSSKYTTSIRNDLMFSYQITVLWCNVNYSMVWFTTPGLPKDCESKTLV